MLSFLSGVTIKTIESASWQACPLDVDRGRLYDCGNSTLGVEGIQGNGMAWYIEKRSANGVRTLVSFLASIQGLSLKWFGMHRVVRLVVFCLAYSQHRAFYGIYGLAAIRLHRAFLYGVSTLHSSMIL
jgi:hypothetical protein